VNKIRTFLIHLVVCQLFCHLASHFVTSFFENVHRFLQVLPLPKDVVTHLDYSSKLRLSLCFFRLKTLMGTVKSEEEDDKEDVMEGGLSQCSTELTTYKKRPLFNLGMFQDLMTEVCVGGRGMGVATFKNVNYSSRDE